MIPYGTRDEGFFPDTLAMLLAGRAAAAGHQVHGVRVFYDGVDPEKDARVRERLRAFLVAARPELVVTERLFDPEPLRRAADEVGASIALLSWGDNEGIDEADFVIGAHPGLDRTRRTQRSPSAGEIVVAFEALLGAGVDGARPIPGVSVKHGEGWQHGPDAISCPLPRPIAPHTAWEVIAEGEVPARRRVFLFGNAGCPYARATKDEPHFDGLDLDQPGLSRLGCAFCQAGGDYQKRADAEVVDELLEQALAFERAFPEARERVLIDQMPIRYLAQLLEAAHARALSPGRWLFAARPDTFVRERERLAGAALVAERTGQSLDLYLSGFESFSDAELARYNKGVTRADLLGSIAAMRSLAAAHPDAFTYARARGHSLILWSPWTRPEDLWANIETFREAGVGELFDDAVRNRVRLYPGLPITLAAERDGLLDGGWDEGGEGAARIKGYAVELPWRFLDARTALARRVTTMLRTELPGPAEIDHLAAATAYASRAGGAVDEDGVDEDGAELTSAVRALRARLSSLTPNRTEAAAVVTFAGACNSGCAGCVNRERWLPDDEASIDARIESARQRPVAIVLAGREPTVHPAFLKLLARAARGDRSVGVVTNARRFAVPRFAEAARRAGLRAASIKLFASDAAIADEIQRVPGAHAQACAGARALAMQLPALEIRAPLSARSIAGLPGMAALALQLGIPRIRIEVALDALGLDRIEDAIEAIDGLEAAARERGVMLIASPLEQGTRAFRDLPRAVLPIAARAT